MTQTQLGFLLISLMVPYLTWAEPASIATVAERSEYRATATHAEVMAICEQLAETSSQIQLGSMGRTTEGREQPLLIISKSGTRSPGPPCLFVMGNIHAGEVCGKEALLALGREFAAGQHAGNDGGD